jgi:hypothetical protein
MTRFELWKSLLALGIWSMPCPQLLAQGRPEILGQPEVSSRRNPQGQLPGSPWAHRASPSSPSVGLPRAANSPPPIAQPPIAQPRTGGGLRLEPQNIGPSPNGWRPYEPGKPSEGQVEELPAPKTAAQFLRSKGLSTRYLSAGPSPASEDSWKRLPAQGQALDPWERLGSGSSDLNDRQVPVGTLVSRGQLGQTETSYSDNPLRLPTETSAANRLRHIDLPSSGDGAEARISKLPEIVIDSPGNQTGMPSAPDGKESNSVQQALPRWSKAIAQVRKDLDAGHIDRARKATEWILTQVVMEADRETEATRRVEAWRRGLAELKNLAEKEPSDLPEGEYDRRLIEAADAILSAAEGLSDAPLAMGLYADCWEATARRMAETPGENPRFSLDCAAVFQEVAQLLEPSSQKTPSGL